MASTALRLMVQVGQRNFPLELYPFPFPCPFFLGSVLSFVLGAAIDRPNRFWDCASPAFFSASLVSSKGVWLRNWRRSLLLPSSNARHNLHNKPHVLLPCVCTENISRTGSDCLQKPSWKSLVVERLYRPNGVASKLQCGNEVALGSKK